MYKRQSPLSPEESTPTPPAPSDFANISPSSPEESTPTPVDPLGVKSKRSKRLPLSADLSEQEDDVFGDFGKISDPTTQSSSTPPIPPSMSPHLYRVATNCDQMQRLKYKPM